LKWLIGFADILITIKMIQT